ncbi:Uncharacterised protein [Mycobacteroides abscessus subsp. abscessus]|nr:Uncharacterised protein [Mycobacteroides abscessus subsp. abscessus]
MRLRDHAHCCCGKRCFGLNAPSETHLVSGPGGYVHVRHIAPRRHVDEVYATRLQQPGQLDCLIGCPAVRLVSRFLGQPIGRRNPDKQR